MIFMPLNFNVNNIFNILGLILHLIGYEESPIILGTQSYWKHIQIICHILLYVFTAYTSRL